ncbi:MAG: hypothetical protein K2H47_04700 [Muribaculaceae bacterium]|nr:hypothetical protein [Muribaculaceae bacterium]
MPQRQQVKDTPLLVVALIAYLLMSFGAWLRIGPASPGDAIPGICLPSPAEWDIIPIWSWGINTLIVILLTVGTIIYGRYYNSIKGARNVLAIVFPVMTASDPYLMVSLGTPTLLCAASLTIWWILGSTFRSENATQPVFVVATIIALGAMIQYAFLILIPVTIVNLIALKVCRWREIGAFFIGLGAPYWVGIGLGLLPLDSFHLPTPHNLFLANLEPGDTVPVLIGAGFAMLTGILVGLNSMIKLYAGNSCVLALNLTIGVTGIGSLVAIFLDYTNLEAYLTTLYLTVAVQIANLFGLWRIPRPRLVLSLFGLLYIVLYILTIAT